MLVQPMSDERFAILKNILAWMLVLLLLGTGVAILTTATVFVVG